MELCHSTRLRSVPIHDDGTYYKVSSYARKGKPASSKSLPVWVEPVKDNLPGLKKINDLDDKDFVDTPKVVNSACSKSSENPPTFVAIMASRDAAKWLMAC